MEKLPQNHYPGILQSLGMTGIMITAIVVFAPITLLEDAIGSEAVSLLYHILSMGVPFLIIQKIRKKKSGQKSFNLGIGNMLIVPIISIAAVALLFGVVSPLTTLIPMPDFVKEALAKMMDQKGVFAFVMMVISAPVLEELLFRGIMLDGLLKRYSPTRAILTSSILFGLVHLNPWQFVTGLVLGAFMGWVYYHTRSLTYTIIIHAAANFSGFMVRFFSDSEEYLANTSEYEFFGGLQNYLLITAGCIATVIVCFLFLKREFNKNKIAELSKPEKSEVLVSKQ